MLGYLLGGSQHGGDLQHRGPQRGGFQEGLVGDAVAVEGQDVAHVGEQLDEGDAEVVGGPTRPLRQSSRNGVDHVLTESGVVPTRVIDRR